MTNAITVKKLSNLAREKWKMIYVITGILMVVMLSVVIFSYLRTPNLAVPAVDLWWKSMRELSLNLLFMGAMLIAAVAYLKRLDLN